MMVGATHIARPNYVRQCGNVVDLAKKNHNRKGCVTNKLLRRRNDGAGGSHIEMGGSGNVGMYSGRKIPGGLCV